MNGTPKHNFPKMHFPFVKADAPKGGKLRLATQGTFDTLNRFSIHGSAPEELLTLQYDMLMFRSPDEPFTLDPLVAESAVIEKDSSAITFTINPNATFADGSPVTAQDIEATIIHLRDKGKPRYKMSFGPIKRMVILSPRRIKIFFHPKAGGMYDQECPLVVAQMIVLSKNDLGSYAIGEQNHQPIQGTGPYRLKTYELGRYIEMGRRPDYWATDYLKGFYNFDTIRLDYYKTSQSQFQAFQAGAFDIFFETNPQNWQRGFNFAAVHDGRVQKFEAEHNRGVLARYFIVNMRRPLFQDIALRKALGLAFDADTVNRMVYEGEMKIPQSTFANTLYAHQGPAEHEELEILSAYKDQIGDRFHEIVSSAYQAPRTQSARDHRAYIKQASDLLMQAGYQMKDGVRLDKEGKPLVI
ncbi:MAG: ABC transporter substrate-binding protein, partial [Alphaproteobacteria bacterium]|nr:ABC transporter substrate-binding protein [Alphaproteobacteria bacterium]